MTKEDDDMRLKWCEYCGEGVTNFCRGKAPDCDMCAINKSKKAQAGEPEVSRAYDTLDRFLRTNLGDDEYAQYSAALETIYQAGQSHREAIVTLKAEVEKWADRAARRTDDWHEAIAKAKEAL